MKQDSCILSVNYFINRLKIKKNTRKRKEKLKFNLKFSKKLKIIKNNNYIDDG